MKREEDAMYKWLRANLKAGVVLAAIGANATRNEFVSAGLESQVKDLKEQINDLAKESRALHAGGPDGLVSPAAAGVMDLHIAGWLDRHLGRKGSLKLVHDYAEDAAK